MLYALDSRVQCTAPDARVTHKRQHGLDSESTAHLPMKLRIFQSM